MKRVTWIVLLLVAFSLVLVACGGDEPEATVAAPTAQEEADTVEESAPEAEPEVAAEPTAEELNAEEPAAEPEEAMTETEVALADLQLSSLDELSSYRYDMVMEIIATDETGQEVTQSMQMILAVSTDPPATSMSMSAEGQEEFADMGNIEFVQSGDTSYIVMGEMGCMALPADAEGAMSTDELTEGFTPDSLMEDLENVTLVGEETIDGIDTLHYTYDETSMLAEEMVGIESMEGHIYLAKDGGYMVRSIVDVVGNSKYMTDMAVEGVQSGVTHIEMNLKDVNGNVEILVPASCEGQDAAADSEWPMMEDASEITSFAGILSYTTASSGNDTIDFYNDAMVGIGYTLDEASSFVSEGNGLLTYTNDAEGSVSITISEDTDSGLTTVTVLSDFDM
jgi:hypothetical protein